VTDSAGWAVVARQAGVSAAAHTAGHVRCAPGGRRWKGQNRACRV